MTPAGSGVPLIPAESEVRNKTLSFRTGLHILAVAVALPYLPVLVGYVPFPADIVVSFPPWEGSAARACCTGSPHPEEGDVATENYPWRTLNSKLHIGNVPLWNFQVFMGSPYQAMPMSALFFPLHWLFSFLPLSLAWSLLFVVRSIVIATTTAIFVRNLGASSLAALFSGFIFALSGWVVAWQGRSQLDSAMWLPLMFLAVDTLRSEQSYTSTALVAVAFALPVLAGHPEVAFQVTAMALLYAAYRLFPITPSWGRYVLSFGAAGLLSLALSVVQLLPTLEWVGLIARSLDFHWGSLASSQSLGFLSRDLLHQPNVDGVSIPEGAVYIGAFTIALLPFIVLWRKRHDVVFFVAMAFFCIEAAYGWRPGYWISAHIPVLAGLPNWRLLVVADFAVAVLAGLAISAVAARCQKREPRFVYWTLILWLMTAIGAGGPITLRLAGHTAIPWGWTLLLVLLSLIIVSLAATRRIRAVDFSRALVVLIAADLITAGFAVVPFVKPADIFPAAPVFEFLRARAIPMWRVAAIDVVYGTQFELPYGLSSAAGYDFPNKRIARVLSVFHTRGEARSFKSENVLTAPKGVLDLTGTRYFVTTDWNQSTSRFAAHPDRFSKTFSLRHVQVFENPDAVPLLSFLPARAIHVIATEDDQFKALRSSDFDGKRTVIVPQEIGRFWGVRGDAAPTLIADVAQANNEVKLMLTADQDGMLYFNESYYPGWVAKVDGMKVPVIRANYAFMAVPVRQGHHSVQFEFAPTSFRVGGLLSALAVIFIAGTFAIPVAVRRMIRPFSKDSRVAPTQN
jgi:hypothetical protein